MSDRTLDQWKDFIRAMKVREINSRLHPEAKRVRAHELKAAMEVIDGAKLDPAARQMVVSLFSVRTKYEALEQITGTVIQDDQDLARDLIAAVATDDAERGLYLRQG